MSNNDAFGISRYDIPVKIKIIPAAPGTRTIVKGPEGDVIGPEVIAWMVSARIEKNGEMWPKELFSEPITYAQSGVDVVGVVHPDGAVDYEDQWFCSVAEWESAKGK